MNDLIKKLVEVYGPSGFEDQIRTLIEAEVIPYADEVRTDAMGNLIAYKKGNGTGRKVMVAAHMDEIGVMVTHITKHGFLRFTQIGGVFRHTLAGNRVQFADGTIGVIASERITDYSKVHPLEQHYIDVGASSREDCHIQVGDAAGFVRPLIVQDKRLSAKAMDDRIGCVVAIEAFKQIGDSPHDLYFVFSTQEEVGTRGAQAAANAIEPEVGLAIDVTLTGDTPEAPKLAMELGKGPAIKVKDRGMIAHAGLVRLMRQRAEEADIPHQMEVLLFGSTDARSMQISGPGCAAGCLSIPCRYVHTQSETVDAEDVTNSIKLLVTLLSKPIDL